MKVLKEPESYTEAINCGQHTDWKQVMDSEIVTYEKPDMDPVETACWEGEDVYIMQVHIEVKTNNDGSVGIFV